MARRALTAFPALALIIGALGTIGASYAEFSAFAQAFPEQAGEQIHWLPTGLFLFLPYMGLAWNGRGSRGTAAYGALAILLALSAAFAAAASSDAQGALVVIYTWPLQCLVAGLVGIPRFRRRATLPGRSPASDAGSG